MLKILTFCHYIFMLCKPANNQNVHLTELTSPINNCNTTEVSSILYIFLPLSTKNRKKALLPTTSISLFFYLRAA